MEGSDFALNDYRAGMAIGIKFRPNYCLEDKFGQIADMLLFQKDSMFNYHLFPTTTIGGAGKELHNEATGDRFHISQNALILDLNFTDINPKEKFDDFVNEYFKTVTNEVYKIVDIHEINLVGIVNKYLVPSKGFATSLIEFLKTQSITNVNTIDFTFIKKIILSESKNMKNVNDYENVITRIIKNPDNLKVFISLDYQRIYNPNIESIMDIEYQEFVKRVAEYNSKTLKTWLTDNE